MKIKKNTVVSLNFSMYDLEGRLIDKNEEPMLYLHGGYENIMPSVESALEGRAVGDTVDVTMKPSEAFGERDTSLIREDGVDLFPNDIDVGMLLQTKSPDGSQSRPFRITKIDAGKVTVDGNHPLAGISLRFEATVLAVRTATKEEIAHGHVHGAHGHDHAH